MKAFWKRDKKLQSKTFLLWTWKKFVFVSEKVFTFHVQTINCLDQKRREKDKQQISYN